MIATRRTLFGLIAAPAVIALPSTAAAQAAGLPDAEIIELERQRLIASAAYDRLSARADDLQEQAVAMFPAKPDALRVRSSDWFSVQSDTAGGFMTGATVQRWREALAMHADDPRHFDLIPAQRERMLARGREVLTASEAHRAACEALMIATGARHASDLSAAACKVLWELEDGILAAPARTPRGLAIKGRMVAEIMGSEPDGTREDFAARCLLADLTGDA